MIKIKVVMPTTKDYTQIIQESRAYLRPHLRPDTQLEFVTIEHGFPSIESEVHGVFNAPAVVLAAHQAQEEGFDGVFVNCFDDPGVYACRESLRIPVVGGYQPAMITALSLGERVGVITTDRDGILSEERKARQSGFGHRLSAIRKVDIGVLDLAGDKTRLLDRLTLACHQLWEEDRVSAVTLGCTAMHYLIHDLRQRLVEERCPITVIEPLANGVCYLEHMIWMGYTNALWCNTRMENLTWY